MRSEVRDPLWVWRGNTTTFTILDSACSEVNQDINHPLTLSFPAHHDLLSKNCEEEQEGAPQRTDPTMVEVQGPALAPQSQLAELSFPLPNALHTTAHVHLTVLDTCAMVFLATSTPGDSSGTVKPMGSFIYAMPDVSIPAIHSALAYHSLVASCF